MAKDGDEGSWIFVDDNDRDAEAYRDALAVGDHPIRVQVLKPSEARGVLLTEKLTPLGVLMDVELSGEAGVLGTGLGLAQDVRAFQQSGGPAYPVIRFANAAPVQANVGGDPISDDLFDDKIEKAEVGRDRAGVQRRMCGAAEIYAGFAGLGGSVSEAALLGALGVQEEQSSEWIHPGVISRLADGLMQSVHVAAGTFLRTCMHVDGILVDRRLLTMRLGVSPSMSEVVWRAIEKFSEPFRYAGVGAQHITRWWSRGLEEAWYGLDGAEEPLAMTSAARRVNLLSEHLNVVIPKIEMPAGSMGECPWRWCALSREKHPAEFVPLDPRYSVRVTARADAPPWVEPSYATLGQALRVRDPRLNKADVDRLYVERGGEDAPRGA